MGFGSLFVPLVGGYLFLKLCNYTRYSVARESGYTLIFESATAGLLLLVAARLIVVVAEVYSGYETIADKWYTFPSIPYAGTLLFAFALGPVLARVVNLRYSKEEGARRAVDNAGNSMEIVLLDSMKPTELIELTLESNKVYIGWALDALIANPARKYVEVFPLFSGYRDDKTQELTLTTSYAQVFADHGDEMEEGYEYKFRIVVPVSQVRTARPFNIEYYSWFMDAMAR